ncbi:hypothetical protein Kfla_2795 [Kribbella flavida DSM 17836]|uniref:DUF2510 domain-containing protein n=1 Tax=Kribbella flavida (strain DSM 17836 / JCM 10339 / NBRC 14399) TaxID=479435 RepID=D2PZ66_KRIFD|nr:DUF2510 domain-containing protein [Kribbella flavida]ADB31860.1 hypothetical protein Kfla_2795 [Kribbella flavida DSM 17836]
MSNPPAGWYPDPTGQPNTIRWWNGTQWTNKTELETPADDATQVQSAVSEQSTDTATENAADDADAGAGWAQGVADASGAWNQGGAGSAGWSQGDAAGAGRGQDDATGAEAAGAGSGGWSQGGAGAAGTSGADGGGWSQVGAGAAGWGEAGAGAAGWGEAGAGAAGWGEAGAGEAAGGVPQTAAEKAAAISAAEKARATWTQKPAGSTNASHWTQQAPPQASEQTTGPDPETVAGDAGEPAQGNWTLKLATDPSSTSASDAEGADDSQSGSDPQVQATEETAPFPDHWRTSNDSQPSTPWGTEQQTPTAWGPTPDPQASPQWGADQQTPDQWGPTVDPQASAQWGQDGQPSSTTPWAGAIEQQSQGQWSGTITPQTGVQQGAGQWGPAVGGAGGWQAAGPAGPVGGGQRQKPSDGKSGGPPKTLLVIAGVVGLVLIVVAGVFFIANRDDKTADPGPSPTVQPTGSPTGDPTGTPTSSPTSAATSQPSPTGPQPGQSKNPKLHEGRIASTAISFPRQRPPWSDRKRLVPQLLNSSGQYVLLQENFDGKNDWYADAFVGALGTSVLFNGNVQATASDLSTQLRTSLYGSIPVRFTPLRDGAVKRSGKNGWYYQQTVTANHPKIAARVLTLTVAVFDLGDGTAVAYISDIPTNRPDLKAAEAQVYKGINVG